MKNYGIRITLPQDDPMRSEHLLGPDWEGFRWYASGAERDDAFEDMREQLVWYRKGDRPSQIMEKIERS
jgi:hypothetical protein